MKSTIMVFISTYWVDVAIVFATLVIIYLVNMWLIRYDRSGAIRKLIVRLCKEAEAQLGGKTGPEKKELVILWAKKRYPPLRFVSNKVLGNIIDSIVECINKYLAENKISWSALAENIIDDIFGTSN